MTEADRIKMFKTSHAAIPFQGQFKARDFYEDGYKAGFQAAGQANKELLLECENLLELAADPEKRMATKYRGWESREIADVVLKKLRAMGKMNE